MDHMVPEAETQMDQMIDCLEQIRLKYMETKDKALWYSMIQLLPESYHQMRTCTMSYENAIAMYRARHGHKLQEWHTFCNWVCRGIIINKKSQDIMSPKGLISGVSSKLRHAQKSCADI